MSSKYDIYWWKKLEEIVQLLKEAYENGMSRKLDVSDIQNYGERRSWYGVVEVFKDRLRKGEMAHAGSLGKVVRNNKLLDSYEGSGFRMVISTDLKLRVEQLNIEEKTIVPTQHREKRAIATVETGDESYIRIHKIVESLPIYRYPVSKEILPENGVYFFYEEGEKIQVDPQVKNRIVRVGTHREQGRFPSRVFNHFGGNKNSSVFRKHLGGVIIRKKNPNDPSLKQWLKQDTRTFRDVEDEVEKELQEHFSFRCIRVDNRNERLELEERLIATLAKSPCRPSPNWLGHFAVSDKIRMSGMWNEQHVDSTKRIQPEHLSKLEELVSQSMSASSPGNALILIPCCKQKNPISVQGTAQPLHNIQPIRNQLLPLIQQTPNLATKAENQRGVLNPNAPSTRAVYLYRGNFYQVAGESLRAIMAGQYPSIHLLIVSAFYGIAKLDEGLKEYELQMGDTLHNGMKVYQFWQQQNLSQTLQNYIHQNNISHVWSLLPDSDPKFQYHRVFNDLWRILRNTQIPCFHVQVPGAGTGTGYKRAQWLVEISNTNPNYLIGAPFPPNQLRGISGYEFHYGTC